MKKYSKRHQEYQRRTQSLTKKGLYKTTFDIPFERLEEVRKYIRSLRTSPVLS